MLQISGPELCIVETKPDTVPSDLRLSTAWPELLSLADEVDLEACDDILHKHTPWGVTPLLYAVYTTCAGLPSNCSLLWSIQAFERHGAWILKK